MISGGAVDLKQRSAALATMSRLTFGGLVLLCLGGCSTVGVYVDGSHFHAEIIQLAENGQFRYEHWSDDGGTVCFALGSWTAFPDGSIETRVVQVVPGTREECPSLRPIDRWSRRGGQLFRGHQGPFKRSRPTAFSEFAPPIHR